VNSDHPIPPERCRPNIFRELVVWDRDRLSKESLGEVALHLMIGSLTLISRLGSKGHLVLINQATKSVYTLIFLFCQLTFVLQPITLSLVSAREGTPSTSSVQVFFPLPIHRIYLNSMETFAGLIKCSRSSLVSAPPVSFGICSSS